MNDGLADQTHDGRRRRAGVVPLLRQRSELVSSPVSQLWRLRPGEERRSTRQAGGARVGRRAGPYRDRLGCKPHSRRERLRHARHRGGAASLPAAVAGSGPTPRAGERLGAESPAARAASGTTRYLPYPPSYSHVRALASQKPFPNVRIFSNISADICVRYRVKKSLKSFTVGLAIATFLPPALLPFCQRFAGLQCTITPPIFLRETVPHALRRR